MQGAVAGAERVKGNDNIKKEQQIFRCRGKFTKLAFCDLILV